MTIHTSRWKWFGNAGHFIGGNQCQFHLCTQVGGYLVSTVGQYNPQIPSSLREEKGEFMKIGTNRTFETMVFKAGKPCRSEACGCGLPETASVELDFSGYNTAGEATRGHLEMCQKYEKKQLTKRTK